MLQNMQVLSFTGQLSLITGIAREMMKLEKTFKILSNIFFTGCVHLTKKKCPK